MLASWHSILFSTIFLVLILSSCIVMAVSYKYDELNRLTHVDYGNGTEITYTYDGVGNSVSTKSVKDTDGDGIYDSQDNCPTVSNTDQNEWDNDELGDVCDGDIDGDRVLNDSDLCPFTAVGETVDPSSGCSITQIVLCEEPWKNHGEYVSKVAQTTNTFLRQGLITQDEKSNIISEAAQSECGKKVKIKR